MAITLKDVAARAGVSYATVSRVLADKPHIRAETRDRVLAAVAQLGYKPNRAARSLKTRRTRLIGILISDIRYDFFPPLVRAVEDVAAGAGYSLFLCNTDENSDREARYIDLLIEENVAGVLIAPTREDSPAVQRLLDADIPVVVVDRRLKTAAVDTVVIDNFAAAYQLTTHLIDNGYRRIAALLGSISATTARERYAGYQSALADHDLPCHDDYIRIGAPTMDNGIAFTETLLSLPTRPDAIFASNHLLASGAFQAIRAAGLHIPDHVALVAVDNPAWTAFIEPGMTVVAQPSSQVGQIAADLLIKRIQDRDRPPQQIMLPADLIIRASSRPTRNHPSN